MYLKFREILSATVFLTKLSQIATKNFKLGYLTHKSGKTSSEPKILADNSISPIFLKGSISPTNS